MRKLVSKNERKREARRKQITIGIALAFIMVLSILGFALQSGGKQDEDSSDKIIYNGFEFIQINGLWRIGNFAFSYNPEEVPEIGLGLKDAKSYQGFPAYVYSENNRAEIEIKMNLRLIAERIQGACIDESGAECSRVPTKTCNDNFIIIKNSNISSIKQEDNCVYIEGPDEELLKLTDQFLFKILGIK